eukprot:TRINITY_DN6418_c0_g1_i11.p1 TRINITY_DN6418_c0_g1~~TRINITY_DN6418_c0_g1_i11.p1  ORF type:complete len:341 (+),score=52.88 TRINITY_DN6418_c0_g1_i11:74-1024(+)
MKLSNFLELGGVVGVHAAASKVFSQSWGRKHLKGTEEEIKNRRAAICAAVALLVMGSRWTPSNKSLLISALVAKLLAMFEDADTSCKAAVCYVFFPIASVLWAKWPKAASGIDTTVHPEFTSTMGKLLGIPSRSAVVKFGSNPTVPSMPEFLQNTVRGGVWGFKALFTVYFLQAVVGWLTKKDKKRSDLIARIKNAFKKALRTEAIYMGCATWSNVAFGYYGQEPPLHGAGPVALFAFEPLSRLRTIAEYYIAHFVFAHYQELRQSINRSGGSSLVAASKAVNTGILSIGLPSVMLLFSMLGRDPPLLGALKSITL